MLYFVIDEAYTFIYAGYKAPLERYIKLLLSKNKTHEIESKMIFVGATYTGPLNHFFQEQFGKTQKA